MTLLLHVRDAKVTECEANAGLVFLCTAKFQRALHALDALRIQLHFGIYEAQRVECLCFCNAVARSLCLWLVRVN